MESDVLQRVRMVRDAKSKNVFQFAMAINMEPTTVNNYFIEKRKISFELIYSILDVFPDISAEWLIRGNGEMYIEQTTIKTNPLNNAEQREHIEELKDRIHEQKETIADLRERLQELKNASKSTKEIIQNKA